MSILGIVDPTTNPRLLKPPERMHLPFAQGNPASALVVKVHPIDFSYVSLVATSGLYIKAPPLPVPCSSAHLSSPPRFLMYPSYHSAPKPAVPGNHLSTPLHLGLPSRTESDQSARSSFSYAKDVEIVVASPDQTSPVGAAAPHVSTLARRIHGWSWQAVRLPARRNRNLECLILR